MMSSAPPPLNDVAVAAAAGVPVATLAAWLRRGHLARPAAGWQLEDAVLLRLTWLLSTFGTPPDAALRILEAQRGAIRRGNGWLVLTRRYESDLSGGGVASGGVLALDRPEDVNNVLLRAAAYPGDLKQILLLDLVAGMEKCRLALARHVATRRPRGRPRKDGGKTK
jgi:hypothetical protein